MTFDVFKHGDLSNVAGAPPCSAGRQPGGSLAFPPGAPSPAPDGDLAEVPAFRRADVRRPERVRRGWGLESHCAGGAAAARRSHKPEVAGSNPAPATSNNQGAPVRLARPPAQGGDGTTVGAQPGARPGFDMRGGAPP